jgi:chemotaxis protein CheX
MHEARLKNMQKLTQEFIAAFTEATLKTVTVQCNLTITNGEPFIQGSQAQPEYELAGILTIISNDFKGSIHLAFPSSVFLQIMTKMLGEEFPSITDDLASGASELLNIIFGIAKVGLNEKGHQIKMAIPMVIRGHILASKQATKNPTWVIPFSTADGEFVVEISEQQDVDVSH